MRVSISEEGDVHSSSGEAARKTLLFALVSMVVSIIVSTIVSIIVSIIVSTIVSMVVSIIVSTIVSMVVSTIVSTVLVGPAHDQLKAEKKEQLLEA